MLLRSTLSLAAVLLAGGAMATDSEPNKGAKPEVLDADAIQRLIKQLGSDEFRVRNAAEESLKAVGETALKALRSAAETTDDVETRARAERLIQFIEGKIVLKARKALLGVWRFSEPHDAPPDPTKECAIIEINAKLYFVNEEGQISEGTVEIHQLELEVTAAAWGDLKGQIVNDKGRARILWANQTKWTKKGL